MAVFPKIRVPKHRIQQIFNEHYLPLVMSGQLREVAIYNEPASEANNQPPGTRSILAEYWDDTRRLRVALAHHYWLPPGPVHTWRIGGSGVPDGKSVFWKGEILIPDDE